MKDFCSVFNTKEYQGLNWRDYSCNKADVVGAVNGSLMIFRKKKKSSRQKEKDTGLLEEIHDNLTVKINYNNREKVFNRISQRIDEAFDEYETNESGERTIHDGSKSFGYIAGIAASILIIATSVWIFLLNGNQATDKESKNDHFVQEMITKENQAGQKSLVHLPDGTRVWLNSESSIRFPTRFKGSRRIVELAGEAFFAVAQNPNKPFIVQTGKVKIRAIGTSFNVMAFEEKSAITVSLVEGKIAVTSDAEAEYPKIIEPGWVAAVGKSDYRIKVFQSDVEDLTAWKDGTLIFDDENFEDVIFKLERWYGVKITVQGKPDRSYKYRGRFRNEYLANILETMQHGKAFDYKIDGTQVYIRLN
ncbi:MAG: FecR domain-containing protein [Cytophagales bacterium]|nr:FecR domain-containing protein [Cytophagales bacterium]